MTAPKTVRSPEETAKFLKKVKNWTKNGKDRRMSAAAFARKLGCSRSALLRACKNVEKKQAYVAEKIRVVKELQNPDAGRRSVPSMRKNLNLKTISNRTVCRLRAPVAAAVKQRRAKGGNSTDTPQ